MLFSSFKADLQKFSIAALGLGTASHIFGILARIFVLARPPVGTLYESILFVSLICAAIALYLARSKNTAAQISGSFAAALLLAIAPFLLQQGESMEMLVAVLNTNFWLATHVLCITTGYGICILAACLAHAYLFLRWQRRNYTAVQKLQPLLYQISLVALLFTAIGTVLGGIWADQSWGRFWGWDPKENGALLIVLWLVWAQHGRLSAHLKPVLFAAATAYLNVIVALAWFGVNLLNVGLHSYGFTTGIAEALALFCTVETIIIGGVCLLIHDKERRYGA